MLKIIIPIYNSMETLPKTLDSLVAQTKQEFVVHIVNDGDKLNYNELLEDYRGRGLKIIYTILSENKGPGYARQKILDKTSTMFKHIMFLDSDDILLPIAVEVLIKAMNSNDLDFCSSSFLVEEYNGCYNLASSSNTPVTWVLGKVYKTSYLKENTIGFDINLRINEDSYFNLVAANCTDKKGRIELPMGIMRKNLNSITRRPSKKDLIAQSTVPYIFSQIRGLKKIIEIKGDLKSELLAASLLNIYNVMMEGLHYKIDMLEGIQELKTLSKVEKFYEKYDNDNFWKYINEKVKCCKLEKDSMFFYKERFIDWFNKYVR